MTSLGYKLTKKGSFTLTKGNVPLSCSSRAVSHASLKTQKQSYELLKEYHSPCSVVVRCVTSQLLWRQCFSYRSHHCNQTADQKQLKEGRIYPGSEFRERIHHCEPGMVTEEAGYNTRTVRKQGGARCRPDITYGDCSPAPTVSTF